MKNTEIKNLLETYKTAKAAEEAADQLLMEDPENTALEAAWNEAWKVYMAAYTELALGMVNFTGGRLSPKECRALIVKKFEHVAALIEALA